MSGAGGHNFAQPVLPACIDSPAFTHQQDDVVPGHNSSTVEVEAPGIVPAGWDLASMEACMVAIQKEMSSRQRGMQAQDLAGGVPPSPHGDGMVSLPNARGSRQGPDPDSVQQHGLPSTEQVI